MEELRGLINAFVSKWHQIHNAMNLNSDTLVFQGAKNQLTMCSSYLVVLENQSV